MNGLYIVTPDWEDTIKLLAVTEQALLGGASIVQYRNKIAGPALRRVQASQLQAMCRSYQRPFIINDFVELCIDLDADGVHVGGMDSPIDVIRAVLGPNKIVGASCYGSMELAHSACAAGASYVAFGGFYSSRVKKYPLTTTPDIIQQAKRALPVPVAVIGGMTPDNAAPLVSSGADLVAAISSVYVTENPCEAAQAFVSLFEKMNATSPY